MIRCYITGRHALGGGLPALLANIKRRVLDPVDDRVDWIQIREKDLSTGELLELSRQVVAMAGQTRILINSRLDVALAAGAHGVHLPSNSPPPSSYKRAAAGLMVGVSCHNRAELLRAEDEGADYALLGPVFPPLSKEAGAMGLDQFGELARAVRIPVLALGGITPGSIAACERAGAAGIAGITLFQGHR